MVVGVMLSGVMAGLLAALVSLATGQSVFLVFLNYCLFGLLGCTAFTSMAALHPMRISRGR